MNEIHFKQGNSVLPTQYIDYVRAKHWAMFDFISHIKQAD